jgi:catalase
MIKALCENSESVGVRGPLCCRTIFFTRKWRISIEGIPEGWYTKGLGALGHLKHDISKYTKAKMFLE